MTVTGGVASWNAANTYVAGGATLQGGLLYIGDYAQLNTPVLTVSGGSLQLVTGPDIPGTLNGSLNYATSNSAVVTGRIIGAGSSLTMNNAAATLTLAGNQNTYGGATTVQAGVLAAGTANALSPNSDVTISGGTLDVSGYAQQIQSLNVGSLGTLNLGVGNLLSISGSAGFASGSTLDIIGSNSITSLPYALMTYSGSPTGTFGNVVGLPSTDKLSYGSGTLDIVASVNAPNYALTASALAHRLIVGGSSSITATLNNIGGGSSPDSINFTGLGALTTAGGTISGATINGSLAPSSGSTNAGLYFASNTLGVYTISALVNSVTGAGGTLPTLSNSSADSITVVANRTVTATGISGLRVIQGQTVSGISTLATGDPGNGDLTAASNTQFTVYNPANGNSVGLFGTTSGGTIGAAVAASGPLGAGAIGTVSLSASGGEGLSGETDTAPSINFTGNVIVNRTVTATGFSGIRVIQGQTVSGISTIATSDPGNGDLTAASNTQFTVYNPANGNSVGLFGTTSGGTIGAAVAASGPPGAGTIGSVALSASGGEGLSGETDTAPSVVFAGQIVTNRTVTSSATDFGLVHVGAALSQSATLSTSGDDSQYTHVTVLSGGTDSNNLLTVSGGSNTVFNSASVTDVRTLSGTAGMAGAISGTVTLTTSGEGLSGEQPINVLVPYTAQVTSGNAIWTSTSSSSWGTHPNWTDSGSTVHAAPGTFAGFTNTDTATFNGQDGVPTINVDTNVSLAGLNFSGTNYTLTGSGSITLDSAGGTATVLANGGGTQTIASALVLSPTAVASFQPDSTSVIVVGGSNGTTISGMTTGGTLSLDGPGELVLLPGTINTTAATIVSQGTLDVLDPEALADGSSLTVGDASLFAPSVELGNHAGSEALASHAGGGTISAPGLAAVPEPGTLALAAGGAALLALLYRRRRRG